MNPVELALQQWKSNNINSFSQTNRLFPLKKEKIDKDLIH